jgi:hypothetical protein
MQGGAWIGRCALYKDGGLARSSLATGEGVGNFFGHDLSSRRASVLGREAAATEAAFAFVGEQ